jgi:hypothetical protein
MNLEELRQKAITFIGSIPKGRIPEALIAPEFFSWSGISGVVERDEYLRRVGVIGQVFTGEGLKFTFDRTTAEGNSVALQVRGEGTLFNGEHYTQSYLFVVEFNDAGQVRHVREYIDTHIVHTMLRPAMERWTRENATA